MVLSEKRPSSEYGSLKRMTMSVDGGGRTKNRFFALCLHTAIASSACIFLQSRKTYSEVIMGASVQNVDEFSNRFAPRAGHASENADSKRVRSMWTHLPSGKGAIARITIYRRILLV